jgi:LysM repeat protein
MGMLNEEKDKAPRSVAEAKKQGKSTYTGKDGKQKAAVYKEDLGKGQSLKDYLNKGGGNNPSKGKNNNNKSSDNKRQAIPGKQIRSGPAGSMDSKINPRLNRQGKIVSAEDAKYLNMRDWVDGGGPGRAGPELQTKKQAIKGDREFGTIGSKLGMTPLGSGEQPSGLAKFITAGGIPGQIIRGIGGVAQDIGGAFKPASYTVKPGDNLSKIAAANNMTLAQLLAKNPGLDPKTAIQPKQQIKIGGLFGGTQTPEQAAATAAMMAQMDRTSNNNSVAAPAPMGVQGVQCPAGQVFNPVTNSCEPAMTDMTQAAQTSMPTGGVPGIANPSYEQIIAYRNNPQAFAPAPVQMAAEGGIMSLVEAEGGNEKTLISDAIAAIESGAEDEAAAVALAKFVQVHGEDALRNLVEKVQSGDYADTRERFANGENGIVNGPGDGSGTDDKVPATIDGEQDVLLTNNEYVLREPTTAALEAALGKGGLDAVNAAEGDAPAVLLRLMNKVQAERQTA